MAKDRGIVLKFNKDLVDNVTGLNPPVSIETYRLLDCLNYPILTGEDFTIKNLFDGSSSTYWQPPRVSTTRWFQLDFGTKKEKISRLNITSNSTYAGILIQGSNDGVVFEEIFSNNSKSQYSESVCEIENPTTRTAYSIIKVIFTTQSKTDPIDITNINVYSCSGAGNEQAFTVVGKELEHLKGPLINSNYYVHSVEKWKPDESYGDNFILLKLSPSTRMRKPEGPIRVIYKKNLGNLQGKDGARVENFEIEFMPSDLIILPNPPPTEENVKTTANFGLDFIKIDNRNFDIKEENIKASTALSLEFTNITGIHP